MICTHIDTQDKALECTHYNYKLYLFITTSYNNIIFIYSVH